MKVTSYAVARPAYYDRTATGQLLAFTGGSVAPHVQTTRFTSTVAAGKKAQVEELLCATWRDSAAATAGLRYIVASVQDSVISANVVVILTTLNTTFTLIQDRLAAPMTLYAGENVNAVTNDSSTGGTTNYWMSCKLTIFDA